ncbi:MAG: PIG-L family deacetylase [Candidatus Hydrogenedentes bacterium]|nr:PIG-L family deacetylase [Candidatus Hydrogenedentota bacterium]
MQYKMDTAQVYVPDDLPAEEALARTTHLAIGAHQDDLEIMAYDGIIQCFQQQDKWFTGVVVTNGRGSPRADVYADYSDDEMQAVRMVEQKKAAFVGEYAAQILLDYSSGAVKDPKDKDPVQDLALILKASRPEVVYTHNLADKHDTHIGVTLKVIEAIRSLPESARPKKLYGCEVWRDLDWMIDSDKVAFDVSAHENLQMALLGVFDSQIAGGKRYDLASLGRRRAHATYHQSHGVDEAQGISFAMDLSPLMNDTSKSPAEYTAEYIQRFADDVKGRIGKAGG